MKTRHILTLGLASIAALISCSAKISCELAKINNDDYVVSATLENSSSNASYYVISFWFGVERGKCEFIPSNFSAKNGDTLVSKAVYFVDQPTLKNEAFVITQTSAESITYSSGGGSTLYIAFIENVTACKFYYNDAVIKLRE